jgi:hypothetical protein
MRTTRKLSQTTKDKISNALKGSNNGNFGKPLSSEHRNNIRVAMLQYWKNIDR